jgi:acyl-CoA reductase-like NAD-dependent aldehyde dehydrogenase
MEPLQALDRVAARADAWRAVPLGERAALLRACVRAMEPLVDEWAATSCRLKSCDQDSRWLGEEAVIGPAVTARVTRLYADALERGFDGPAPGAFEVQPGQLAVPAFPAARYDALLFPGVRAELWLEPGAEATRGLTGPGGVAAVMGAGNVSSILPLDALHQLLREDRVAVLKLNPVMAGLRPVFERALAPLVEAGYLAFVEGGVEEGTALIHDERVAAVHVTGSHHTYDAIVWGTGEEAARRRAAGTRLVEKPVTAELGCVSPVLVVPERWDRADLRAQARSIAGMVANNGSFNCNAAKLIVTSRHWPQRGAFLAELRAALAATPLRPAWYPGAEQRWQRFADRYPQTERLGEVPPGAPGAPPTLPWALIPGVDPEAGELALSEESFCGVVAECALDVAGAEAFLDEAVRFVNEAVWGTLSCSLVAAPTVPREAVDRAVAGLRYGGVAVNGWPAILFALGPTTWGAFPGHTPEDVGSGIGWVHNTGLLDHPQKSVVRFPFRPPFKPVWDPSHRRLRALGRSLARFEARPGVGRLLPLAAAGALG